MEHPPRLPPGARYASPWDRQYLDGLRRLGRAEVAVDKLQGGEYGEKDAYGAVRAPHRSRRVGSGGNG